MHVGVLDEEGDTLVNVNMVDREKADKNVELKKKKPEYKPYDEEESVDDMAMVAFSQTQSVLEMWKSKYFNLEWLWMIVWTDNGDHGLFQHRNKINK